MDSQTHFKNFKKLVFNRVLPRLPWITAVCLLWNVSACHQNSNISSDEIQFDYSPGNGKNGRFVTSRLHALGSEALVFENAGRVSDVKKNWGGAAYPLFTPNGEAVCMQVAMPQGKLLLLRDLAGRKPDQFATEGGYVGRPIQFSPDGSFLITKRIAWAGGLADYSECRVIDLKSKRIVGTWGDASFALNGKNILFVATLSNGTELKRVSRINLEVDETPLPLWDGDAVLGTTDSDVCLVLNNRRAALWNIPTMKTEEITSSANVPNSSGDMVNITFSQSGFVFFQEIPTSEFRRPYLALVADFKTCNNRTIINQNGWPAQSIAESRGTPNGFLFRVVNSEDQQGWVIQYDAKTGTSHTFCRIRDL